TMNYAYFLAELNYAGGFQSRELLVLDEAHNAEAMLMSFVQVGVNEVQLRRAGIDRALPPNLGTELAFEFAEDLLPELKQRCRAIEVELQADSSSEAAMQNLRLKHWLDSQLERIRLLLETHGSGDIDWVVERRRGDMGESLTFKPVEVGMFADASLFGHAERVLVLSATILDAHTYLRRLGIAQEEVEVISVPATFHASRRPVVVRPAARLTRHYLERDLPLLAAAIADLAADHANEK